MIHGDVKPSNVIVRPDGGIVLVDFGISSRLDLPSAAVERRNTVVSSAGAAIRVAAPVGRCLWLRGDGGRAAHRRGASSRPPTRCRRREHRGRLPLVGGVVCRTVV